MLSEVQSEAAPTETTPIIPVFLAAGAHSCSLDDILAAAAERGELARYRERWEAIQADAAQAEARGLFPEPAEIEAATNTFRYARDLVSAEECERWLAARGLTFDDLTECVTRRLQAKLARESDATEGELPSAPGVIAGDESAFRRAALLADAFTGWAHQLAWCVALACEAGCWPTPDSNSPPWAVLEAQFQSTCAALATPEHRRRELASQRLRLLRVTYELVELPDASAAREAALCAREDQMSLGEVAAENRFPHRTEQTFAADLPPDWQRLFLSAKPGDVIVPPLDDIGEGALVLQLLRRQEPTLEDREVVERLDSEVRQQHFGELEARHIRWLLNVDLETEPAG